MRAAVLSLFLAALGGPVGLAAIEKASPALQNSRQTSTAREISVKPLFLYSARGRRDPFTFDISFSPGGAMETVNFNISELKLVGFLDGNAGSTALFYDKFRTSSYRFRRGQLFGPGGLPIANVKGSISADRQVSLAQGESSIAFKLARNPKLESLGATITQDRKEQQR